MLNLPIGNTVSSRFSKVNYSKALGFLLGIPLSWPGPPVYLFAFGCIIIAFIRRPQVFIAGNSSKKIAVYSLIFIALLSNIIGAISSDLNLVRVVTTSFFFILLIFDEAVDNKRDLLVGFTQAMFIWAILILVLASILRVYEYGFLLFTVPDYRLWGSPYFPDWPNYLAFMLSVAFMLNVFLFRRPFAATIQFAAALLTTSRTPLLALGFCIIATMFSIKIISGFKKILLLVSVIISVVFLFFYLAPEIDKDLLDRLLIFNDRVPIYGFALHMVSESPLIGHGAVLLDESVGFDGFPSFHDTYLDIAVRNGIPSLLIFLWILIPNRKNLRAGGGIFLTVVLFFLIGSIFQNFLKHPHIIMIYVVLINSGYYFLNNETKK